MYSTVDTGPIQPSGLKRLARRDLPTTPRTPRPVTAAAPATKPAAAPRITPELTVSSAMTWLLRGLAWIVVLAIIGGVAGYGYTLVAKPRFTAYTDLVVDPANLQLVTNDLYATSFDQNAQLLDVESKLRVLTSGNVLMRVIEDLDLASDPEFLTPSNPLSFLGGAAEAPADPSLAALGALEKKVTARREERSFVVTLAVSTENADKSALIASTIVAAFQAELAKAESDGATRAAASLMDRLGELKAGVTAAEEAVATFRQQNGLEESNGELVNTQTLASLSTRLIDARQALISVEARYAELTDAQSGKLNADAIQTPTMVALRTQYGLIKQEADAAAAVYGPLHPSRGSGERQLAGLQAQIDAEASRYIQSIGLDLDQARRTVAQLEANIETARNTVASDGTASVQLRDLERDAKAKSEVYEAFLTRASEITERQQLDTTNIRVISPATPPAQRSWPPRGYLVAGAGAFGGGALGVALALGLGFLAAARQLRKP
jgi:succinoglycan biosynthesis transport protein ExoP